MDERKEDIFSVEAHKEGLHKECRKANLIFQRQKQQPQSLKVAADVVDENDDDDVDAEDVAPPPARGNFPSSRSFPHEWPFHRK